MADEPKYHVFKGDRELLPPTRPLSAKTLARIRAGIKIWPEPERLEAEAALALVENLRARFEACFKCGGGDARRYVARWTPGVLSNTERRPEREVFLCDQCHGKRDGS